MNAKQYLGQAYQLDQRVNLKLQQISALRSLAEKVTSTIKENVVSHTANTTSLQDVIIRLMEVECELNQQIDDLVDLKTDIIQKLNALCNIDYQLVLEKRYLYYMPWHEIAADLQFGLRWVHILHTRALQVLDGVLNQKEEVS